MTVLGIDFGTSNTAAGWLRDGQAELIPLEDGSETLPTAVFLDFANRRTLYGRAAAEAMMDGLDGRFMRALKSVLGTPLAREKRQFLNERLTLIEVIARFLTEIKNRAESSTKQSFIHALSGRPVRFHSSDDARDAQALVDLTDAYQLAGFEGVSFLAEPEAAALAVNGEGINLIVDIGGGTSDFTVCRTEGGETELLGSYGIRLGGTDFDRMLSLGHVMPLFGHGAEIGSEFGSETHTAPNALFNDLASWEKIAFLYGDKTLREVRRWEKLAPAPRPFHRLGDVLEMHLGHDVAYAVEAGKIAANTASEALIDLGVVEKGLNAPLSHAELQMALWESGSQIAEGAKMCLAGSGIAPDAVDRVVFVGGSSLLGLVQQQLRAVCPQAEMEVSEVFTAVVHGLAIAAGETNGHDSGSCQKSS
ncbi:Hsp70 family protein [Celeribacter litoreus]|uniref:Hsp70 family protein n=1 Tax=Celeribacter litoreus TaxID=2876714 RepID=UPI001CCACC0E|nr:Hsp70 family protein [Celeribacter litoreus]MCA0042064.1 Hsp70 family protein [Celeribacter litoreus]